jgi:hypothetical protein
MHGQDLWIDFTSMSLDQINILHSHTHIVFYMNCIVKFYGNQGNTFNDFVLNVEPWYLDVFLIVFWSCQTLRDI